MSSLIEWHNRIPDSGFHIYDSSVDPSDDGHRPIIDFYDPTTFCDENGVPYPGLCDDINKEHERELKKDCRRTGIDTLGELTYPTNNSADDLEGFNFPHSKQRASLNDSDNESDRSFDINAYEENRRNSSVYDKEYPPLQPQDCRIYLDSQCSISRKGKKVKDVLPILKWLDKARLPLIPSNPPSLKRGSFYLSSADHSIALEFHGFTFDNPPQVRLAVWDRVDQTIPRRARKESDSKYEERIAKSRELRAGAFIVPQLPRDESRYSNGTRRLC
jgi:hypothetical protein